jgi:glycosyltransferase involved in cell wall biosynthesis
VSFKLTILWSALASYSVAFFRELALRHDVRIQLIYQGATREAPYVSFDLSFCDSFLEDSLSTRRQLGSAIVAFNPDAVLMISWNYRHFMRIARRLRRRGVYVVSAMDNQWCGGSKQYLGILASPIYLWRSIDNFLVPGTSQACFARKLGYPNVWYGYAAADVDSFRKQVPITLRQHSFLFVGRLVPAKNIAGLIRAYGIYRSKIEEPWYLKIAGTGPLTAHLKGIPGIDMLGFVQPAEMAGVMNAAQCLVLPSLTEPWGVVIQEAAAAGLPVIASSRCGAASAYIREGLNGFVVGHQPEEIAAAMLRISQKSKRELGAMSQAGIEIANSWTPSKLASYFDSCLRERLCHISESSFPTDSPAR